MLKYSPKRERKRYAKRAKYNIRGGLTTPEITDHIQKTSQELRGGVEKKLPKGFTEPIEVEE